MCLCYIVIPFKAFLTRLGYKKEIFYRETSGFSVGNTRQGFRLKGRVGVWKPEIDCS